MPVSARNPKLVLAVLSLGIFMTLLDLTIVNIAIPSIVDSLHASLDQVLLVLNAYSLLYAVLLITSARLGDLFGQRKPVRRRHRHLHRRLGLERPGPGPDPVDPGQGGPGSRRRRAGSPGPADHALGVPG